MKYAKFIITLSLLLTALGASEMYSEKFLFTSFGVGYGHVKDMGTSPLRYHGTMMLANASYQNETNKNTINLSFGATGMVGLATLNSLNYFDGSMDISYLHDLPLFKNNKFDLRLGGVVNIGLSGLYSPAYQNATFNIDMRVKMAISTRFAYTIDIERKQIKFAGMYFNIRKQKYMPYFKANIPALTFNGRPEYAYVNENDLGIFDRHYFFGGLPLSAELGVNKYLPNGNIIGLAYTWDMFSSGSKDIYLFESAFHQLVVSLYFKLN